jgi:hypothetical protein
MIGQYQFNTQQMQKEITTVIEKNTILNAELTQLKGSECDCVSKDTMERKVPFLCNFVLLPLMLSGVISVIAQKICDTIGLIKLAGFFASYAFIVIIGIGTFAYTLGCWYMP